MLFAQRTEGLNEALVLTKQVSVGDRGWTLAPGQLWLKILPGKPAL